MINEKTALLKSLPFVKAQPENHVYQWMLRTAQREKPAPVNLKSPRLINNFTIGCDPEFILQGELGNYEAAESFDLGYEGAFGKDGSGRPVELRAAPSRFAVRVVASLLNTLRLLAAERPRTLDFNWMTGGYISNNPIGGHLHFGRKNAKVRDKEVVALDIAVDLLDKAGLFSGERAKRCGGSRSYGQKSDYRAQNHGYEYRTFPSWLMSPGTAHLVMTISKLAIRDKDLWNIGIAEDKTVALQSLANILGVYRYLDDDAALAHRAMKHVFTSEGLALSFRKNWGIDPGLEKALSAGRGAVPSIIEPDEEAVQEVAEFLVTGSSPKFRVPKLASNPIRTCKWMAPAGWSLAGDEYFTSRMGQYVVPRGFDLRIRSQGDKTVGMAPGLGSLIPLQVFEKIAKILEKKKLYLGWSEVGRHTLDWPYVYAGGPDGALAQALLPHLPFCPIEEATPARLSYWNKKLTKALRGGVPLPKMNLNMLDEEEG